jgi:hypothetical protein
MLDYECAMTDRQDVQRYRMAAVATARRTVKAASTSAARSSSGEIGGGATVEGLDG